ncbi:MAG: hypothetical protein K2K43_04020 [Alistipes sp.]|nr:hypothetical protein [Alistipes sp.]
MKTVLLLVLCAVVAAACAFVGAVLRGRNKRLLLGRMHGIGSSLSEEFGISVLCSGVGTPECIEALLKSEYTRFEAVVVLDAAGASEAFARLTARYRMIRVEWRGSQEFPEIVVRSLWRSRRRSCRRLVLVDRPQGPEFAPADDWNAAAAVAAYDYLLPVDGRTCLLPDAVTRLVAELGEHPYGTVAWVRSYVGAAVSLVAREAVLAAGGFGADWRRGIGRRNRIGLWEPLAYRTDRPHAAKRCRYATWGLGLLVVGGLAAAATATASGRWTLAAVPVTAAVVAGAVLRARQAVMRVAGGRCISIWECKKSLLKNSQYRGI